MTLTTFLTLYDSFVEQLDDNAECCGQEGDLDLYEIQTAAALKMRDVGEDIRKNYNLHMGYEVFSIMRLLKDKGVLEDFLSCIPSASHVLSNEIAALQEKKQQLADFERVGNDLL